MSSESPKALGYARVSSLSSAESGLSVEAQTERIKKFFAEQLEPEGCRWGGLYCDEAVSGGRPLQKRPAGRRLLRDLRHGDHIIIPSLDRGFRRVSDGASTIAAWDEAGYGVHVLNFLGQPLDLRNAQGRLILHIALAFAEFEREVGRERNKISADKRRERGMPIGKPAPKLGQMYVGRRGRKTLTIDEHDSSIMRHLVKWKGQGWSFDTMYWHLVKQRVWTSKERVWTLSRVKRAYYAEVRRLIELGLMVRDGFDDRGNKKAKWVDGDLRERYFANEPLDQLANSTQVLTDTSAANQEPGEPQCSAPSVTGGHTPSPTAPSTIAAPVAMGPLCSHVPTVPGPA